MALAMMKLSPSKGPVSKKSRLDIDGQEVSEIDETHGLAPPSNNNRSPRNDELPSWFDHMKSSILEGVDTMLDQKIKPMRQDIQELEAQMQETKSSIQKAESLALDAKASVKDLRDEIYLKPPEVNHDEDLRKRVQEMEIKFAAHGIKHDEETVVLFGGLQNLSWSAATGFVSKTLKELQLDAANDIFFKGAEFGGILFAKFGSPSVAEKVVLSMSKSKSKVGESIWCKKGRPLETRVPLSLLLGLRRQLIEWNTCSKSDVRVDDNSMIMKVGGVAVAQATVLNKKLNLQWLDPTWSTWTELQSSSELKDLMTKAEKVLSDAYEKRGKGGGKCDKGSVGGAAAAK